MIKDELKTVKEIHKSISASNDMIIKETENLRIALLNLKIEDARIKEATGIVPISDQIERTINTLHDTINKLVKEDRKDLRNALNSIEEYINKKEKAENE